MRGARRSILVILIAFAMLLVQSVFSGVLAPHPWAPCLTLPFVFALGAAPGVHLVRGALTSFVLGYLYDVFTGNPVGVYTFVFVLGFLTARVVSRQLSFRGPVFEIAMTFALSLLIGGLVELIRDMFTNSGLYRDGGMTALTLFASALVTALIAPLFFALVRSIDPVSVRASL